MLIPLLALATSVIAKSPGELYEWPDAHDKTIGQVWPQPQTFQDSGINYTFLPLIKVKKNFACDILDSAVKGFLHKAKIVHSHAPRTKRYGQAGISTLSINVNITICPAEPPAGMDESYTITTTDGVIDVNANEVWGVIRALETAVQLIFPSSNGTRIKKAYIQDYPRFSYRGLLLDTSRHFFSVPVIKTLVEMVAANKMNVFHWHIVDNEAFPFKPLAYPELGAGAYDERHVYTAQDMKDIVAFARLRGVRVIPEIDTPGHVKSWGKGIPQITSRCFDVKQKELNDRAILDPTKPLTYDVLASLFKEVYSLFPDHYVHLGGDETAYWSANCWENNPNITAFMKLWNFKDVHELQKYYFTQLLQQITTTDLPKKTFMLWEEALENGLRLGDATLIGHVWRGNNAVERAKTIQSIIKDEHMAVLSSCWYLDHLSGNYDEFYNCDPHEALNVTDYEKSRVIGGEACMWGESVDGSNVLPRIFPRASSVAEKLWSNEKYTNVQGRAEMVWPRLYEWQCRMAERGYPVEPGHGPGFCAWEYQPALPDIPY